MRIRRWKIVEGVGIRSVARSTLGVKGCAKASKWGVGQMTSMSIIHTDLHKPNNKLVNNWDIFGAWMNHGHTQTHKTHPNGGYTQMSFCLGISKLGISKFPKLRLLTFWRAITSCANLRLSLCLNKSCRLRRAFFNDMWHATYMEINQGDFQLLVVRSQIGNLIPNPSFGHNLCFKYSNGPCKFILDI
jgi:hypothetical protein